MQDIGEQTLTSDQRVRARGSLGLRSIAAFVDIVILFLLVLIPYALFSSSDVSGDSSSATLRRDGDWFVSLMLWFLYFEILETRNGQTVGKMLFKLRVLNIDGSKPDATSIAIRTIFRIIDDLPFLYLLGFIVASNKDGKQRIGDLVAKTMVVKK